MLNKVIRYCILVPIGLIFIPFLAVGIWMSPIYMYKSFFLHLKSGEPFGVFDQQETCK